VFSFLGRGFTLASVAGAGRMERASSRLTGISPMTITFNLWWIPLGILFLATLYAGYQLTKFFERKPRAK
jgi:hypothetical protein